jgi:NADPH-dependent glutamate synthase beta subunit-like oxidoreductase/NAD(P)H-flavin reductase
MTDMPSDLALSFGLRFDDLYELDGLRKVDDTFLHFLGQADEALVRRLTAARTASADHKVESELMIELAPHLEDFLAKLFGVTENVRVLQGRHNELAPLYSVKRLFVQRRAVKGKTAEQAAAHDGARLERDLVARIGEPLSELAFARHVSQWLNDESRYASDLEVAAAYALWATLSPAGREKQADGVLFKLPHKVDSTKLVPLERIQQNDVSLFVCPKTRQRERKAFHLTDPGTNLAGALDEANYCIWCHNQGKDSCSKGLRDKKTGAFEYTPAGISLAGCPLDERISEMNLVKSRGYSVGALAIIAVDNPLCAATGHRICNDCMKACIFQKQEPVNIPQVETRSLKDVLSLPWGFEIYGLLTRWNPLNFRRSLPGPSSGYKVLVVGLGPAGFTLAHHLLNDGHAVFAVDGLKIEPLARELSGVDAAGARVPFRPIREISDIYEDLNDRTMAGFGGVAEYGITVRWNKNFLKIVRLLLERRTTFAMYGGVRFGGTLSVEDAFALGFDHIALCLGAGKPTFVNMKNGLAPGVRQASDFLMALQLTGAAKSESIANLTVRLPIAVIGGGLTAIDTATEALAYYPVQVEKFLSRCERLDPATIRWSDEEAPIAEEFLAHARALRAERALAQAENRQPRISHLLSSWGGATVIYRRRLVEAPSYTLNHEEVDKAMQEGIRVAECLSPKGVVLDRNGHAEALQLTRTDRDDDREATVDPVLPAKTIVVAAGTQPNTVLNREDPLHFQLDGRFFRALDEDGLQTPPERIAKPQKSQVLTSFVDDGRAISFFGDLHPSFAGNVVKAMASATRGYPVLSRVLSERDPTQVAAGDLKEQLDHDLRPTIHAVNRLTPTIVEVIIRAPQAARKFRPGQFFRLQNYETYSAKALDTRLAMEGLALTGAWVDPKAGLISTIVLEMGGSSSLCQFLRPNEPVVLMGPTGEPTEISENEALVLVGGGLGNAVLFSIGQEARSKHSKVLYFAGYKSISDRYMVEQIERAADTVIWCCDEAPGFAPGRPQDRTFVGNIVQAMKAYSEGKFGESAIRLSDANRLIVIGSDRMMAAVSHARHTTLRHVLKPDHVAIGSINSPMQCMMKEICGQCLQLHRDPVTHEETVVFSCLNQDQRLDCVDFTVLRDRLSQNSAQERLTRAWIGKCLSSDSQVHRHHWQ